MASHLAAAADYRRELGGGLIQRWSTAEDTENIAELCAFVFRDREDEPLNIHAIEAVRNHMSGNFPWMGSGDYAVIEDTTRQGNPLVACTCLWRLEWEYEGIPFGVGQPEFVVTLPEYRNRGLIRRLFEMLHARSETEGHFAQAITGILYFYRQFGYEYALELEGRRVTYLSLIPQAKESAPEPYSLQRVSPEDIPLLIDLYNRQRSSSMVWNITSERYWRYYIEEDADPRVSGKNMCVRLILDKGGNKVGYVLLATRRRSKGLNVYALNISAGVSWHEVAPSFLRALQTYGMQIPAVGSDVPPCDELSFWFGSQHPFYDVLGETMAPYYEPPYAWYVRVPDVLAFVRHIAPVLENRLANSVAASYSGDLTIDFFRGGMRIVFEKGCITHVEPWKAPAYKSTADASCPALVFLQLLFGYRSLYELRFAFPDVRVENSNAALLLNTLFPKKFSWVIG